MFLLFLFSPMFLPVFVNFYSSLFQQNNISQGNWWWGVWEKQDLLPWDWRAPPGGDEWEERWGSCQGWAQQLLLACTTPGCLHSSECDLQYTYPSTYVTGHRSYRDTVGPACSSMSQFWLFCTLQAWDINFQCSQSSISGKVIADACYVKMKPTL